MKTLRFYLEQVPANQDEFEWALYDGDDLVLQTGRGTPERWPAADRSEGVLAAPLVRLTSVNLPRMAPVQLQTALAYALEDKLAGEPEAHHVAAGTRQPDGTTPVAVVSKAWLAEALERLRARGVTLARLVPESCLAQRAAKEWIWVDAAASGFVVTDEGTSFTVDQVESGLPAAFALALDARALQAGKTVTVRCYAQPQRQPILAAALAGFGARAVAGGEWDWRRAPALALHSALDLLCGEFAPESKAPVHAIGSRLRVALWIGIAAIGVHILASIAEWTTAEWRTRNLASEMRSLYQQAFPDAPLAGPVATEFVRHYSGARHARGQLAPDDVLPLLARVAPVLQRFTLSDWRSLAYAERALTLEFPRLSAAKVRELQSALRAVDVSCLAADFEGGTRIRLGWVL